MLPTRSIRLVVAGWLLVWAFLHARALVKNPSLVTGNLELVFSGEEHRRIVTYGREWYVFFTFCADHLPERARYQVVGLSPESIHRARLLYLLYPRVLSQDPEFVIVYQLAGYHKPGSKKIASLNPDTYILQLQERGTGP